MQYRKLGPDGPTVGAVGIGGMLLSISGRPPEDQGIRVIHAALDAGVSFIDTADSYCLDDQDFNHNEKVVGKALRGRRERVTVATKVGCLRPRGAWTVDARPETLIRATHRSLDALAVDTLDLLQLYAPDNRVPLAESLGALTRLKEQGKAKQIGICNVSLEQLEEARKLAPISTVQVRWNVRDRRAETSGLIAFCEKHQLTLIAYSPFGGTLQAPSLGTYGKIGDEARRRRMSPYRLVLAWMINKSPAVIPIPGARRVESIVDSVKAGDVRLTDSDVKAVELALEP